MLTPPTHRTGGCSDSQSTCRARTARPSSVIVSLSWGQLRSSPSNAAVNTGWFTRFILSTTNRNIRSPSQGSGSRSSIRREKVSPTVRGRSDRSCRISRSVRLRPSLVQGSSWQCRRIALASYGRPGIPTAAISESGRGSGERSNVQTASPARMLSGDTGSRSLHSNRSASGGSCPRPMNRVPPG
jgi:hypothetical protein